MSTPFTDEINDAVNNIVRRHFEAQAPESWKLVPLDPTEDMLSAGDSAMPRAEADLDGSRMMGREVALECYRAILAAAPEPPLPAEQKAQTIPGKAAPDDANASEKKPERDGASGIYIASKTKHASRWRSLRAEGVPIISTWIDEAGPGESESLSDLWRRCIEESSKAIALLLYREPGEVLKGGWIELGSALAAGVPVYAVGIEEFTVSNHSGIRHFANLDAALRAALDRQHLSRDHTARLCGSPDER